MQVPNWAPVANGVWRTMIGSTPTLDLLSQSGVAPRVDGLTALPEQPFPLFPETITVAPAGDRLVLTLPLERIPLLVRDGGIIPLMPPMLHAPRSGERVDLEVRQYGVTEGVFDLHDDDGETYDYEHGACGWVRLCVDRSAEGELVGTYDLFGGLT